MTARARGRKPPLPASPARRDELAGSVLRGRDIAAMDLPQLARDAADMATPLFPATHPAGATHCTWPSRYRYEPIPDDRTALRRIVEEADIIAEHGRTWLLIACPPPLLDYLCTFDAATEDDEDNADDEPDEVRA